MSHGCGTLVSPGGYNIGKGAAASGNGKQHGLPLHPRHDMIAMEDIDNHWDMKQPKKPTRLWGGVKPTRYGGEMRVEETSEHWTSGEYWNVDSNIRRWGEHEIKRNAACANHDLHRHDQKMRMVLHPHPGSDSPPKVVQSGAISCDSSFVEAWGFDLGSRDRQGKPATRWNPTSSDEHFRSTRSYSRNIPRMTENARTLMRTMSTPGKLESQTLRPEDVAGEAGEVAHADDHSLEKAGRTHGARFCRYWDRYDHTVRREASKMSNGVHSPNFRSHPEDYPFSDNYELRPAALYTKKYRTGGESTLRAHVSQKRVLPFNNGH
mmetsp:Transcript_130063/g.277809  ORF Transcript_130063/g.277809 Transcript_130063/m.277809 type:complete len:321 (-) Transcript_130063:43-1005(-)